MTDHQAAPKKYLTNSEEEDQDFFDYEAAVAEYNAGSTAQTLQGARSPQYEQGSLMQRIVDPFAGAPRDEEGAIVYTVTDKELSRHKLEDEAHLKEQYEKANAASEVWDVDAEDEDAWRGAMLDALNAEQTPFKLEQFHAVLDEELAVFKKGEKYNFVKDIKDAYRDSLKAPLEQRIFSTIPDHAFWDIKKPLHDGMHKRENRYNPFRGREYRNFFEMRDAEDYLDLHHHQANINNSISTHKPY